jgi:hypothetical protein
MGGMMRLLVKRSPLRYVTCLCVLSVACLGRPAYATPPTPQQLSQVTASGLAWVYQKQRPDGGWSDTYSSTGVFATSAVLDAMAGFSVAKGSIYMAGVASLASAAPASVDALSRQLDTLNRLGLDVSTPAQALKQLAIDGSKGWGAYPNYGTSLLDTGLAATSLSNVSTSGYTTTDLSNLVCKVFGPGQRSNGGWGYAMPLTAEPSSASSAALLPTVYAVVALKNMTKLGLTSASCGSTSYSLATLMANGVVFLKTKQNTSTDRGFGENSASSALETALVYKAINAVNSQDAVLVDAQNYLINTQKVDGSWSDDAFVNALALQVFATPLTISGTDGVPDVVKTQLGLSPTASLVKLPGNGVGLSGINTTSSIVSTLYLGVPMSKFLEEPSSWTSGNLPPGLTFSGSVISGTPTAVGQFNAVFTATTTAGSFLRNYSLTVEAHPSSVSFGVNPMMPNKNSTATLTALVMGDHPYGTVKFYDDSTLLATVNVAATDSAVAATQTSFVASSVHLAGGFRKITASYSGDTRNQSSTSATKVVPVNPEAGAVFLLLLSQ